MSQEYMMMGGPSVIVAERLTPSSDHPGDVNLRIGDGSVRFSKDSIAPDFYRARCARNGGEVTSSSDY